MSHNSSNLAYTVMSMWLAGISIEKIAFDAEVKRHIVERILIDYYRCDIDGSENETAPYDTINLSDFHPLTRAKIHQVIHNEPDELRFHSWELEVDLDEVR